MITSRDVSAVIGLLLLTAGLMVPTISIGHIPGIYLLKWLDARDWESTPAEVTYAKLAVIEDGGLTTYEAKARYTYQWSEQTYRGRNVSFSVGSDSIGSFQQGSYRILKEHFDSKTPIIVWVNPNIPGESVVFRRLRLNYFCRTAFVALITFIFAFGILIFLGMYVASRIKNHQKRT